MWDAAFARLGYPRLGFDLSGTPFGEDGFDQFWFDPSVKIRLRYRDVFTGFIFVNPTHDQYCGLGIPGYFGDGFREEALRRARLLGEDYHGQIQQLIAGRTRDTPVHAEMPYKRIQTLVSCAQLVAHIPGLVIGLIAFLLRKD